MPDRRFKRIFAILSGFLNFELPAKNRHKLKRHTLAAWWLVLVFGLLTIGVAGICREGDPGKTRIHIADNGDGTFTNPVMPNAHWSDPCLLRVKDDFYCMTSSAETCPLMQVLHSRDLVNWDVVGSVLRRWPDDLPSVMNWSPRISYLNGRYRVMFHITEWGFRVMEAEKPEGPWHYVQHHFGKMDTQWGANVFTDDDGALYMIATNWIQRLAPDALSFAGERIPAVQGHVLENPSLIKKDGYYYWFESQNGTCTLGNQPDKGRVDVWRSRNVTGPYEGPHELIRANDRFQSPNTGTVVLGPDHRWWIAYNEYDMLRFTMCRQMHLDLLEWDENGWPSVNKGNGPGLKYRKPIDTERPTWFPDLNDEFDQPELEGVTTGILGRKWLFKRELPGAWSLREHPGWLRLTTMYPSIQEMNCANLICQRPTSAYYSISTHLIFHPRQRWQQAGIIVRELNTTNTIAIGLDFDPIMRLKVWQNNGAGLKEIAAKNLFSKQPDTIPEGEVYLKIDMEGMVAQCSFSMDNVTWTRLGPGWPAFNVIPWQDGYFTAFHPGLFSGETVETPSAGYADFDYFHMENYERLSTQ